MRSPVDHKGWYYANSPSMAVPDGLGDEDAIRAIWAGDVAVQRTGAESPRESRKALGGAGPSSRPSLDGRGSQ
jgi:hypothetical protein